MQIAVPAFINADGLIPFLTTLGAPLAPQEDVVLDFSGLRRVTPAGLVALAASVVRWRNQHHSVVFTGLHECPITGYLQRMDVLSTCGVELNEDFKRHDGKGRFVPVRLIDSRVDEMGHELSACLAPGGEDYGHALSHLYDLAWYVFTETANNVRQHSQGLGYVSAQVNHTEGMVRMALADNGRGILKSFQDAGLDWSQDMRDSAALSKALEPRISSKGRPSNEGVGLTLVSNLVRLVSGWLMIVSGNGVLQFRAGGPPSLSTLPPPARFQGTLIGLTFRQKEVQDYGDLLHRAKIDSGLLHPAQKPIIFRP